MKKILALTTFLISLGLSGLSHAQTRTKTNLQELEELSLIKEDDTPEEFKNKYYRIPYTIKNGDSFASIIKRFVKLNSLIDGNTQMVQKTIKNNPNITDWENLNAGDDIFLYVSPVYIDKSKIAFYLDNLKKKPFKMAKFQAKIDKRFNSSLFYMASYGQFTQENASLGSINFIEASPISMGGSVSYFPKKSLLGVSGSVYYSYLLPPSSNINNAKVDIPGEVGFNVYGEYDLVDYNFNIYGGIDYEQFTTFDLQTTQTENRIALNENSIFYLTVGITNVFNYFNRTFLTKVSLSRSVSSSISTQATTSPTPYEGMKYLIYVNTKLTKKVFAHSLLKVHQMSASDDLTTVRFGVGIGYSL